MKARTKRKLYLKTRDLYLKLLTPLKNPILFIYDQYCKFDYWKEQKRIKEVQEMSLEDIAKYYVKIKLKDMVKSSRDTIEYCVTERIGSMEYYLRGDSVIEDIGHLVKVTRSYGKMYYIWKWRLWGLRDEERINMENELREFAIKEFKKEGCSIENRVEMIYPVYKEKVGYMYTVKVKL